MSAPGAYGCSPFRRSGPTTRPAATAAPANLEQRPPVLQVGDDLALRAGLDPAWDAVLAVYLAGHARWPDPFQPRKPSAP